MTRRLVIAVSALLVAAALMVFASPAVAQPAAHHAAAAAHQGAGAATPAGGFHNSKGVALAFWVFAIAAVAGALFVITRRNMVSAVMGLVGTFFALAALYVMLYAHFLAAIQVLVYAGAIMVLFVFVIMILNAPENEPWALQGLLGKGLAGVALLYFLYRLASVLWTVKDQAAAAAKPIVPGGFEFGATKAVGKVLFTDYLFPFEAISIVLLVAVVGALAIARPMKPTKPPTEPMDPAASGSPQG